MMSKRDELKLSKSVTQDSLERLFLNETGRWNVHANLWAYLLTYICYLCYVHVSSLIYGICLINLWTCFCFLQCVNATVICSSQLINDRMSKNSVASIQFKFQNKSASLRTGEWSQKEFVVSCFIIEFSMKTRSTYMIHVGNSISSTTRKKLPAHHTFLKNCLLLAWICSIVIFFWKLKDHSLHFYINKSCFDD